MSRIGLDARVLTGPPCSTTVSEPTCSRPTGSGESPPTSRSIDQRAGRGKRFCRQESKQCRRTLYFTLTADLLFLGSGRSLFWSWRPSALTPRCRRFRRPSHHKPTRHSNPVPSLRRVTHVPDIDGATRRAAEDDLEQKINARQVGSSKVGQ